MARDAPRSNRGTLARRRRRPEGDSLEATGATLATGRADRVGPGLGPARGNRDCADPCARGARPFGLLWFGHFFLSSKRIEIPRWAIVVELGQAVPHGQPARATDGQAQCVGAVW